MDTKELRIGNIVQVSFVYGEVKNIFPDRAYIEKVNGERGTYGLTHIAGIPLNPLLLEICGFERREIVDNGIEFSVSRLGPFTYNSLHGWWFHHRHLDVQPNSLHQLQNLYYALMDSEIEIKRLINKSKEKQ